MLNKGQGLFGITSETSEVSAKRTGAVFEKRGKQRFTALEAYHLEFVQTEHLVLEHP